MISELRVACAACGRLNRIAVDEPPNPCRVDCSSCGALLGYWRDLAEAQRNRPPEIPEFESAFPDPV